MRVKAAVCQLTSSSSITNNCATACRLIAHASSKGAKLVCLPEACDYIAPAADAVRLAEGTSSFVKGVQRAAKENDVYVSVGIHEPVKDQDRVSNSQLLIDNEGRTIQIYRKLHLFDVEVSNERTFRESATTRPGDRLSSPMSTPIGQLGLLTCYDVRFPEASLALRFRGAEILTYPSAFAVTTGKAHWLPLLQTRAIETQCYILAAAQTGEHWPGGRRSYGHSMIIDPYGKVLVDLGEQEDAVGIAEIDLDYLAKVRQDMPLWLQRRTDIYPRLG